jgi:phosphotriesterase-related protein
VTDEPTDQPVPTVETVRGPVPVSALGTTLMHEHVFVLTRDSQENWPGEWDEEAQVAGAVSQLRALREQGVTTIVDPTVEGLGRDVARVARVNAEVDLHIVVATGIYTYADLPGFFRFRPQEAMVERFVGDIVDGIQGTGVKAAFLKCAIDEHGLLPGVERVLRAVAAAHRETGAPVMVHTHPASRSALHVQRVLGEEGVEPERVVLAHSGDGTDPDHLAELAEAGFVLGMDRFGLEAMSPLEQRVEIVAELCRRGHAGRMVLSHDAACHIDWIDPVWRAALPQWNFLHIVGEVVPALRERGVTAEQVQEMLVEVPARFFGTECAHRR